MHNASKIPNLCRTWPVEFGVFEKWDDGSRSASFNWSAFSYTMPCYPMPSISGWSVMNFEFLVCRPWKDCPPGAEASVAGCWAKVSGTSAITSWLCTRKQHNLCTTDENWWELHTSYLFISFLCLLVLWHPKWNATEKDIVEGCTWKIASTFQLRIWAAWGMQKKDLGSTSESNVAARVISASGKQQLANSHVASCQTKKQTNLEEKTLRMHQRCFSSHIICKHSAVFRDHLTKANCVIKLTSSATLFSINVASRANNLETLRKSRVPPLPVNKSPPKATPGWSSLSNLAMSCHLQKVFTGIIWYR